MGNEDKTKSRFEGIQPDVYKGIQPSQALDTSNPPDGGSGVDSVSTDNSGDSDSVATSDNSND